MELELLVVETSATITLFFLLDASKVLYSLLAAMVSWLAESESLGESLAWSLTIANNVDACGRRSLLEGAVTLLSFSSGENFVLILEQMLLASRTLFLGGFV